jgi:hypothetical protein
VTRLRDRLPFDERDDAWPREARGAGVAGGAGRLEGGQHARVGVEDKDLPCKAQHGRGALQVEQASRFTGGAGESLYR